MGSRHTSGRTSSSFSRMRKRFKNACLRARLSKAGAYASFFSILLMILFRQVCSTGLSRVNSGAEKIDYDLLSRMKVGTNPPTEEKPVWPVDKRLEQPSTL